MRALTLISLGVSLVLGAGAIFFGRQFVSVSGPEASAAVDRPVPESAVRLADWPDTALPPGVLRSVSELGDSAYARGLMVPGEPLLEDKLDRSGRQLTLAANIEAGMRAVSIVVRDDTGVAGFVLPGDRVDVNEFLADGDGSRAPEDMARSGQMIARSVLRGVRVLAVDQTFESGLEGARPSNTVTLEVTPQQALRLGAASQRSALGLALIGRAELSALDAGQPQAAEAPPPRPGPVARGPATRQPATATIRVINGAQDTEVVTPVAPPASVLGEAG